MEAPEVPLEQIQEDLHHLMHSSKHSWVKWVALTSALLAAVTAVVSLTAGYYSHEAMIEQIQSSDQWSFFQAKSVKANILTSKMELLTALGKAVEKKDREKLIEYKNDQEKIQAEASRLEKAAGHHLEMHKILARSVTLFQLGICVSAISVLTNRRSFWRVGLAFGTVGMLFLIQGTLAAFEFPGSGVG